MKTSGAKDLRSDRRTNTRDKIRKVGRIVIGEPQKVVSCIILDLSGSGALLLVHDKVPETFALYHKSERTLRDVRVTRRQNDTIGVQFVGDPVPRTDARFELLRD